MEASSTPLAPGSDGQQKHMHPHVLLKHCSHSGCSASRYNGACGFWIVDVLQACHRCEHPIRV